MNVQVGLMGSQIPHSKVRMMHAYAIRTYRTSLNSNEEKTFINSGDIDPTILGIILAVNNQG